MVRQRLGEYNNAWFDRGKSVWFELAWIFVSIFLASSFPGSWLRKSLLSAFGAEISRGVVIKPRVRVKFPWKLAIGSDSWIGEGVWLDNLADISIGSDCCLSQGVYVCTGNHDWSKPSFDLVVQPVTIADGSWIGAFACIAPGVVVGNDAVVAMGSIVNTDVAAASVVQGNPAKHLKNRN